VKFILALSVLKFPNAQNKSHRKIVMAVKINLTED